MFYDLLILGIALAGIAGPLAVSAVVGWRRIWS